MTITDPIHSSRKRRGLLGVLDRLLGSPSDANLQSHSGTALDHPIEADVIIAPGGYEIRRPTSGVDTNSLDDLLPDVREGLSLLPPLPTVVLELLKEIQSANSSAASVANIISSDPTLAASLLRAVNSAAFGLPNKIHSVPQAVSYLGFDNVRSLVVSLRLETTLPRRQGMAGVESEDLWAHSLAVSYIAAALADRFPEVDRGFVATLGLMHDVGRLAMLSQFPQKWQSLHHSPLDENESNLQREARIFGADHAAIGAVLANRWDLPADLTIAIRWHHDPSRAFQSSDPIALRKSAALMQLANQLAKFCFAYVHDMQIDPPADGAMELLGLEGTLSDLLDAKVRAAASQAILLADENSTRPIDAVRPFIHIHRAGGAADLAERLLRAPEDPPRIHITEAADEMIDQARHAIRVGSDIDKLASAPHAPFRIIAPPTQVGIRFIIETLGAQWETIALSPRLAAPCRSMLRALLPNLLVADPSKMNTSEIEAACQWNGTELRLAIRSPMLAFADRLPKGFDLGLSRRTLETELANVLNLGWFNVESSLDGAAMLFKLA